MLRKVYAGDHSSQAHQDDAPKELLTFLLVPQCYNSQQLMPALGFSFAELSIISSSSTLLKYTGDY